MEIEEVRIDSQSDLDYPDTMHRPSNEETRPLFRNSGDRQNEVSVSGLQRGTAQQQEHRRSKPHNEFAEANKVASVWSVVCATELGLLPSSSLKDVSLANYSDLDILCTTENGNRSFDFETSTRNDYENVISNSTSIFNASWPFIDPERITRITYNTKSVRKRSKKGRWTRRRQRKPKDSQRTDLKIDDEMSNLSIKRVVSSLLERESKQENLNASNGLTTRLSDNKFSSTELHSQSLDNDEDENHERLSGNSESSNESEEDSNQVTLDANLEEIARADYSASGYSKFCSSNQQQEKSRNRQMELSEYPEYFMNVLPVDNNTEENNSDTTESVTSSHDTCNASNAQNTNSTKFVGYVPCEINARISQGSKAPKNENISNKVRKTKPVRKNRKLRNSKDHNEIETLPKRRSKRRIKRRREWGSTVEENEETGNSVNSNYDSPRISCSLKENYSECKSDSKDDSSVADTHDATKIVRERCKRCCKTRRNSRDFTNAICTCKSNLKNTAVAIMQDIQAHIQSEQITKDIKDVPDMVSSLILADSTNDNQNSDLSKDVPMEYDWEINNEFKEDSLIQETKQSSDLTNADQKRSSTNINTSSKCQKRRLNRSSIDCKFVDRTETAFQNVFDECIDFDSSTATSSLKINVSENWKSEDSDSNIEMIHSSWRRSSLKESDNESDSALLLARRIVNGDMTKDEEFDNEDETMENTRDKYNETPGTSSRTRRNYSVNDSHSDLDLNENTEDTELSNRHKKTKDIITYKNKKKTMRRWSSIDESDVKVQNTVTKNRKIGSKINLTRRRSDGKNNDLEFDGYEEGYVLRRVTRALIKMKKTPEKKHHIGQLVWGCCSGWWPALIIDAEHVGMHTSPGKLWVYWIGESQISSLTEKTQIQPFSWKLEHRLIQPSHKDKDRSRAIDTTIQMLRQHFDCALTKPYFDWILRNIIRLDRLDDLTFYPYSKNIQEKLDTLKNVNSKVTQKYISKQNNSPERTPPKKKQIFENFKDLKTGWQEIEDERLPLQYQYPGVICWAKIAGHCWWPAMIIDYRDCCLKEPSFGCQWIMWYGDYKLSEVRHLEFLKFHKGLEKMRNHVKNTIKQSYTEGVLQASKDYCSRLGCNTDNWTLDNVFEYFSNMNNIRVPYNQLKVSDSNKVYDKYSDEIVKKINELKSKPNVDDDRKDDIKESDALRRVISGESTIERLCLKCLKFPTKSSREEHPFFIGSLCKECSDTFKPCMFVFGNDGKCFYCTACASSGTVIICDREDCPRVYCTACLKYLICPKTYDEMLLEDPWECFLCRDESRQPANAVLRPRLDWKNKVIGMFRTNSVSNDVDFTSYKKKKKAIRVLSLFDGLSTGLLVLLKLGIEVEVYYASEIDKDALMISSAHFGDRIHHLGDVRGITKEKIQEIVPIDLLIGGSPCNDLSLVNPARLGLHDPKGTGILFFEYCRIKKIVKNANKDRHMFWLFENVASMPSAYRLEINKHLGQEPDVIDSADFSPQHRLRLYWHNLPFNPYMPLFHKEQDVQDILTKHCDRHALVKKIRTVTTRANSLKQGKGEWKPIMMNGQSDSLWITELEEIFGFPRHYTDVKNLSATNRQKLIGKSWSVQTLMAILRPLCSYFKCNASETSSSTDQTDLLSQYHGKYY